MRKPDPLTDVLAQIPAVAMFAKYIDAARTTGAFQKRLDALEVSVTVDVAALAASVAQYWGSTELMSPEVVEEVKKRVQFQVDSNPDWLPIRVDIPEWVTMPEDDGVIDRNVF